MDSEYIEEYSKATQCSKILENLLISGIDVAESKIILTDLKIKRIVQCLDQKVF
jgi:hypothetical protein